MSPRKRVIQSATVDGGRIKAGDCVECTLPGMRDPKHCKVLRFDHGGSKGVWVGVVELSWLNGMMQWVEAWACKKIECPSELPKSATVASS